MNFCTLFDCNYLDRALALMYSLEESQEEYHLFAFTFDSVSYETVINLKNSNITVISRDEFIDERLKNAKLNRSAREFLWTCSSYSILYVLNNFEVSDCTYIDADMYFYNDCSEVYLNFLNSGCDAGIISHNFYKCYENSCLEKKCGKFCVEFNTFKNNINGLKILNWWIDSCFDLCTEIPDGIHFGDQKYLDEMIKIFDNVYIYSDEGMGIAPWNLSNYILNNDNLIENRQTHKCEKLIFYHFHSMSIEKDYVNIHLYVRSGKKDEKLIDFLYKDYINKILQYRNMIDMNIELKGKTNKKIFEKILETYHDEMNVLLFFRKCLFLFLFGDKDKMLIKRESKE